MRFEEKQERKGFRDSEVNNWKTVGGETITNKLGQFTISNIVCLLSSTSTSSQVCVQCTQCVNPCQ